MISGRIQRKWLRIHFHRSDPPTFLRKPEQPYIYTIKTHYISEIINIHNKKVYYS